MKKTPLEKLVAWQKRHEDRLVSVYLFAPLSLSVEISPEYPEGSRVVFCGRTINQAINKFLKHAEKHERKKGKRT